MTCKIVLFRGVAYTVGSLKVAEAVVTSWIEQADASCWCSICAYCFYNDFYYCSPTDSTPTASLAITACHSQFFIQFYRMSTTAISIQSKVKKILPPFISFYLNLHSQDRASFTTNISIFLSSQPRIDVVLRTSEISLNLAFGQRSLS